MTQRRMRVLHSNSGRPWPVLVLRSRVQPRLVWQELAPNSSSIGRMGSGAMGLRTSVSRRIGCKTQEAAHGWWGLTTVGARRIGTTGIALKTPSTFAVMVYTRWPVLSVASATCA
jgi:hypothetical protein